MVILLTERIIGGTALVHEPIRLARYRGIEGIVVQGLCGFIFYMYLGLAEHTTRYVALK